MGRDHLILGEITDYLTGEVLPETHDERARQFIARHLVVNCGYMKDEIVPRLAIPVEVDGKTGKFRVDFAIRATGFTDMIVVFRPGSLVTRQRPVLSAARLLDARVAPLSVITNGKDAIVMDTASGAVIGAGIENIPARNELLQWVDQHPHALLPEDRKDKEERILFAMEILADKECDDFTCGI